MHEANGPNIFQIEIPKRAAQCQQGQEAFSPGMEYYSILLPHKEKGVERFDFCLTCWEKAKNQFNTAAKTAWKAKIASKKEVEDLSAKTRDEKAFYHLKEVLQNPNNEEWAETFVLTLYLARRKILYLRQEIPQEDGFTLCVYEVAATEEMLSIRRKSLACLNIEEVQAKIAHKLRGASSQ